MKAELLSSDEARQYGVRGLAIRLTRTDATSSSAPVSVRVPKETLSGLFGADYASRVRWVQVPATSASPKSLSKAMSASSSPMTQSSSSATMTPQTSQKTTMLAAQASASSSSGTGTFTATDLKPSSTWGVSEQTGDFSWEYPLPVPPAAAGPSPDLSASYDSQSIDGETASTNNQPAMLGDGWSLGGGGFIERTYVSCSQDDGASGAVSSSGDLCWKSDNATLSMGGHSGQLVHDTSTGVWKLQSDDGSRIEHLVGTSAGCAANGTYDTDCWRLTTRDGTQYYFGLNQLPGYSSGKPTTNSTWTVPVYGNDTGEPCHASTFAASSCVQAWRWNLDYVVDTHANAEAFYYNAETNRYAQNNSTPATYVRGGSLNHIDYGLTASTVYASNAASDQVVFGYSSTGRCSTSSGCSTQTTSGQATTPATPANYPDTPYDQNCASGACSGLLSPSFWTTAMLTTITTKALVSGAYASVDQWAFGHSFPSPGDGTSPALWLTQITHTGYSGSTSATEPATIFTGATLQNRVWVRDGLAPLDRYRITSVTNNLGGVISVNYSPQDCTPSDVSGIEANPQSNTRRCFPQWWTPQVTPAQAPQEDLFHKYVVTSVIANPKTGNAETAQETDYIYGTPAWKYDTALGVPTKWRTWSVYAGYNTVETRSGSPSSPSTQETTDYTYYQGLNGDRAAASGGTKTVNVTGTTVPDSAWFAGRAYETKTLNGVGGAVLSDVIDTPWASAVTSNDGTNQARMIDDGTETTTEPLSTGGVRTTTTTTTYDTTYGLPVTEEQRTSDATSTCTTTTYAPANTTAWLIGLESESLVVSVPCGSTVTYPDSVISDTRTSYDGAAWNTAATKGDATTIQVVDRYTGTTADTAHWATTSTNVYDALGRVTKTTDVLGHTQSTAYTPATGGPVTGVTSTNTAPFNWTTSIALDPARGVTTSSTDENGKVTTATYDVFGRVVGVWLPGNSQSSNPSSPSTQYTYTESQTGPSSVATQQTRADLYVTSYDLFDGLGQKIQTQAPAEGGGAVITDAAFDAAGRSYSTNSAYWTTSVSPSGTQFVPTNTQQIPSTTTITYDGAGRPLTQVLSSYAKEQSRTTTAYPGADRVDMTPPAGGTPTTVFTNSMDQQTKLVEYLASSPSASATTETTTYGYNGRGDRISMTDPAGNQYTWGFDLLGHQVTATDPDTGTTTQSVDDAGEVLAATDGRGVTLATSYDALGRQTALYQGAADSTGTELASYTYDTLAKGQLTSSSSYVGSKPGTPGAAYTTSVGGYTDTYKPTSTTVSIPSSAPAFGGTSYKVSDGYTSDGMILAESLPSIGGLAAERLRYSYDGLGLFGALSGTSSYYTSTRTGIGQIADVSRALSTGVSMDTSYGYDPATGNVNEITSGSQNTSGSGTYTTQADHKYTRNQIGDVTKITTTGTDTTDTQCFTYDQLRQMSAAWTPSSGDCTTAPSVSGLGGPAPYWQTYTVDAATGNRTAITRATPSTSSTDTYSYAAAGQAHPHAVTGVAHSGSGTDSYTYDTAGNTVTRPGQTLSWDAQGRLAQVTTSQGSQSNVYAADGSLLLQTDPTGSTLFLGATEVHQAAGASAATAVRTYADPDDHPVAERSTSVGVSGSVLRWITADLDGTADLSMDQASGTVTRRYTDPFGNLRGGTSSWPSGHGFQNMPVDAFASVTTTGDRDLDTTLGKFLSVDSVFSADNPVQDNGYAYAGNSPVTNMDPTGNCYDPGTDSVNHKTNCSRGPGQPVYHNCATCSSAGKSIVAIQKRDAARWKPLIKRLRAGRSTHASSNSRRSKAKAPKFGSWFSGKKKSLPKRLDEFHRWARTDQAQDISAGLTVLSEASDIAGLALSFIAPEVGVPLAEGAGTAFAAGAAAIDCGAEWASFQCGADVGGVGLGALGTPLTDALELPYKGMRIARVTARIFGWNISTVGAIKAYGEFFQRRRFAHN